MNQIKRILSHPSCYHYIRQIMTGGLPFRDWIRLYGFNDTSERIADLGCGPSDILRYLSPQCRPGFYLGIDISERYLDSARQRAAQAGVSAEFHALDLVRLPHDRAVQSQLVDLLEARKISRVLLMGVLHHIDNESVRATLNLVHQVASVRSLITADVIRIPGRFMNNLYCRLDRGEFIRDEAGYDALIAKSAWRISGKRWTTPGASFVKNLHYLLEK
jgi:SAM-dependent methyltransferase